MSLPTNNSTGSGKLQWARSIKDYPYEAFRLDRNAYLPEELPLARAVTRGETVSNEKIQYYEEDGSAAWISVSATPLFDKNDPARRHMWINSP
ncbi:MAG: hypothetical protein R6U13_01340 [Desulfatiglandaceae bacterium]